MDSGIVDSIGQEKKQMASLLDKTRRQEEEIRALKAVVDGLKELIWKTCQEAFPPEIKCESERRY